MSSQEYTIGQAMNEIQELSDRIELLGNIVDKHEMGDMDSVRGVGTMLEEFAGRLYRVRVSLEEHYHLPELEEEINRLNGERHEQVRERVGRAEQRGEVFRKHSAEAEREIEEQGLDVASDPDM